MTSTSTADYPVSQRGLAAIAVVCIVALLISALLRSRIALLLAVVVGVVAAGPALANSLVNVVWA
jgi:hypothetical protein